ncbi:MAG: hypothetical protein KAI97_03870, partial [Gemmatimonadetes bacterium]|nr:hypothetical protein [Gemmatimonadota bacterium]
MKSGANPATATGAKNKPFSSLDDAEATSGPGDAMVVLHVPADVAALDGGITLKVCQQLLGTGPSPTTASPEAARSKITNSAGDAVVLADYVRVEGLHIVGAYRGGAVGLNASGVEIRNNLIEGFNAEVLRDQVGAFNHPVAGINLLATGTAVLEASSIEGNVIRDGPSGIGLDILNDANATHYLLENTITDIANERAVRAFVLDDAQATLTIEQLFVDRIGHATSNSDKILVQMENSAQADVIIRDFVARNSTGVGGAGSAGIELVLGFATGPGDGMRLNALIEDSDIQDMPSGGIEMLDFSNNADVTFTVRNTLVRNTSGPQGFSILVLRSGIAPVVPGWGQGGRHTVLLEGNELREAEQANVGIVFFSFFNDASPLTLDSWDIVVQDNVMANGQDGLQVSN